MMKAFWLALLMTLFWPQRMLLVKALPMEDDFKAEERKCFVCYSCNRVETSQSLVCDQGFNHCMTVQLITGEVDRMCSTANKCQSEKLKPEHKDVRCCNTNNCNGQPGLLSLRWSNLILLTTVIVGLLILV